MPSAASQRRRSKLAGLIAAIAVAALFAFVIWFFAIRPPPNQAVADGGPTLPDQPTTPATSPGDDIPDIVDLGSQGSAGGMYIELTDKDDPNKSIGIIEAASVEPVGLNEKLVEQPRAWLFLDDGRSAFVEADRGRFMMPPGSDTPEAGQLVGNVRLRLFDAVEGATHPDPETSTPLGRATFVEPLAFDFRRSRLSSTGRFVIWTPQIEWAGTHLTAVLNQVRQRLEVVEVRNGEYIRYTPEEKTKAEKRPSASASTTPSPHPRGTLVPPVTTAASSSPSSPVPDGGGVTPSVTEGVSNQPPADQPDPPKIDRYRITFLDDIAVTHKHQRLDADRLELWTRLIDNSLPTGAIDRLKADIEQQSEPAPPPAVVVSSIDDPGVGRLSEPTPGESHNRTPAPLTASGGQPVATTHPAAAAPVEASQPAAGPIELRWTGAMRIVPIDDADPPELADDDLLLRLTAEKSGRVAFADTESGASGAAVALDYAFTRAQLLFSGPGGHVELAMRGSGTLTASRLTVGLGTGLVSIVGPGSMDIDEDTSPTATAQATSIGWGDRADFAFAAPGGRISSDLTRATLAGKVEIIDGQAHLTGSRLDAHFVTARDGRQRLERLTVEHGSGTDGLGGLLSGDEINVAFADGTRSNEMDPTHLVARGSVVAEQHGSSIRTESLDVALGRDMQGDVQIATILATGGVDYAGADGATATGTEINADNIGKSVTLLGAPAVIAHRGATITSDRIDYDDRNRRARIDRPGSFIHTASDTNPGRGRTEATWSGGMAFDDLAGTLECWGDARAISRPEHNQKDTIAADRVLIELTPASRVGRHSEPAELTTSGDRQLLRASAYGSLAPDGTPIPASAESRVYAANDPDRVERMFYLEGTQITADNTHQRLGVPQAGKLLILDRRDRRAAPSDDATLIGELSASGPGLTRFEWRSGMLMERHSGTAMMRGRVRVRHKSLDGSQLTDLHCDQLLAQIRETSDTAGSAARPDAVRGQLTRAEAIGDVYFSSQGREVGADRLLYDALNARALATANPGHMVTLFDASRGSPVEAEALTWDLVSDRISIERPNPIFAPSP